MIRKFKMKPERERERDLGTQRRKNGSSKLLSDKVILG